MMKGTELIDRLKANDSTLIRLDITTPLLQSMSPPQINTFLSTFPCVPSIQSVHLSGLDLQSVLTAAQLEELILGIASMQHMQDLCIFQGGNALLNEHAVAQLLQHNDGRLTTLLLFQFASLHECPVLAGALRQHASLQRLTLTLPAHQPYGALDLYSMCFAAMPHLQVLHIQCGGGGTTAKQQQEVPILTTDAFRVLLSSTTITSLYLEHCGLLDDHMDVLEEELMHHNRTLQLLDLKDNTLLSDDVLYSMGRVLPHNPILTSVDLSGAHISPGGGQALAQGMARNTTLTHLELEGTEERYRNEFNIQLQHDQEDWMKQIYYYLRLNRARAGISSHNKSNTKRAWVERLNRVSDQLDCLYYFIREESQFVSRMGQDTRTAYNPRWDYLDHTQTIQEEDHLQQQLEANAGAQMIMQYLGQ